MKVAILGAGAIGGWLAAELAAADVPVAVVARNASLQALRTRGLRVLRDGREQSFRVTAGSGAELGMQDIVIVATKAQDVGRALPELRPLLGPSTAVVSALNGLPWWFCENLPGPLHNAVLESVDPGGKVAAVVTPARALGCVVHASTSRPEPGLIRIGKVDRLIFGEPTGAASDRVSWLVQAFSRSGLRAVASDNIRQEIWSKLWGNMNMNPISALTRATTGRMLDDAEVRNLCLRMMEEMAACGERIGLPFTMSAPDRMAVTRKLGDFKTSMLQDLENGAPLEYQPQLGAVVEVARRVGVPAPFCESVLGLIRQLSCSVSPAA